MTCQELMTPLPTCCQREHTLVEVAAMMRRDDVGAIPVASGESLELIGVVTDRDIVVKAVADGLDPTQTSVAAVMTLDPVFCQLGDSVKAAVDLMSVHQIRRLPVVNERRQVVGIIAQADVATRLGDAGETAHVVEAISQPEPDLMPS